MALLWVDGFDQYATSGGVTSTNLAGNYVVTSSSYCQFGTMPVLGGRALYKVAHTFGGTYLNDVRRLLPASYSSGTLGLGAHFYTGSDVARRGGVFSFASSGADVLYNVLVDETGKVCINSGTNLAGDLAISSGTLNTSSVYHIEVKLVIAGSSGGSIAVKVNGVLFAEATDITTNGTAISMIGMFGLEGNAMRAGTYLRNFYIWDGTGSLNNDWLGERIAYTSFVNEDTAETDWSLSTGINAFDLLNDAPPSPDTNYIESDTVGDRSTFGLVNLPDLNFVPAGILPFFRAEKTDAGVTNVKVGIISGEDEILSDDKALILDTPSQFGQVFETNPETGLPWTASDLNALQLVIERS